jgi:hypothetical protein
VFSALSTNTRVLCTVNKHPCALHSQQTPVCSALSTNTRVLCTVTKHPCALHSQQTPVCSALNKHPCALHCHQTPTPPPTPDQGGGSVLSRDKGPRVRDPRSRTREVKGQEPPRGSGNSGWQGWRGATAPRPPYCWLCPRLEPR